MPGLVPGIHVLTAASARKNVDGRDKPSHDERAWHLRRQHRAANQPALLQV
jgi:hypothetical protein